MMTEQSTSLRRARMQKSHAFIPAPTNIYEHISYEEKSMTTIPSWPIQQIQLVMYLFLVGYVCQ